jgi:hypothetical protein
LLADESPEHLNFNPESPGGGSVLILMTVEDPDRLSIGLWLQEPKGFGPSVTSTVGASDESSIRSDIIGKSASACRNDQQWIVLHRTLIN